MSDAKDISNEELAKSIIDLTNGGDVSIAHLAEAARRLAALPRIYDVAKGERPEDESRVVMLTNDTLLAGGVYYSRSDRVVTSLFKYEMKDVDYVVTLSDLAAWIKGVKG